LVEEAASFAVAGAAPVGVAGETGIMILVGSDGKEVQMIPPLPSKIRILNPSKHRHRSCSKHSSKSRADLTK
jgi:hypothetical protein